MNNCTILDHLSEETYRDIDFVVYVSESTESNFYAIRNVGKTSKNRFSFCFMENNLRDCLSTAEKAIDYMLDN